MADAPHPTGSPPVVDQRPVPRGVLPRGVQTWLMAGLAVGMVLIMLVAGRPEAPLRSTPTAVAPQPPSAERVRDYQDRLRAALQAQAAQEALAAVPPPVHSSPLVYEEPQMRPPEDPIAVERKRREYESLFASNIVLSRRPEKERPDAGRPSPSAVGGTAALRDAIGPSIDEIADAVVRATVRAGGTVAAPTATYPPTETAPPPSASPLSASEAGSRAATEPIGPAGPLHRLLEGTIVDTVLTNRLDGTAASPVNCLVTNPVYSHSGRHVLIPSGARLLGETRPVQTFGESRLAVAFHRLLMPDGRTYSLDQFLGLNQIGDAGLRDRVNQHYLSTFGAAAAVGLISGFAQFLGTAGFIGGRGDRTVVITGGVGDTTAQATAQIMHRYLNRLPTVTIREGHRVRVYLTSDLELPAYEGTALRGGF